MMMSQNMSFLRFVFVFFLKKCSYNFVVFSFMFWVEEKICMEAIGNWAV